MKIYILKHKGANSWRNLDLAYEVESVNVKFWAGMYFFRLKDAKAYQRATVRTHMEIVACELPETQADARRADYGEVRE
jgi:hypothetical protein